VRILRFTLTEDKTVLGMPAGARVLTVAIKPGDNHVSLWAISPNGEPDGPERRCFQIIGTGWKVDLPDGATYLGTAVETRPGFDPRYPQTFCWHVFEMPSEPAA
jgi:hypothetical protein